MLSAFSGVYSRLLIDAQEQGVNVCLVILGCHIVLDGVQNLNEVVLGKVLTKECIDCIIYCIHCCIVWIKWVNIK